MSRLVALVAVLAFVPVTSPRATSSTQAGSLTLCIVVDVSASMGLVLLFGFDRAAADDHITSTMAGLTGLLEPGDRVRFGRIARTIAFGPGFVPREDVGGAVRALTVPAADRYGPSPVWDAIDQALELLDGESGRRAVIAWTDGRASGNRLSRFDVARRARAAGIPVHVVAPPTERLIRQTGETAARIRPATYLEWMAGATGGQFHEAIPEPARPHGNTLKPLAAILDGLRGRPRSSR
jgi:hypothetical protein